MLKGCLGGRRAIAVAVALAAASSFGEIRARCANRWSEPGDTWQMPRHEKILKEIAAGGAKVVFLGDSITQFWENRDRGLDVWNRYFADGASKALNLGFAGDLTDHVIWRITEGGELDGYEAKCIVLTIGTNNCSRFPFNEEPVSDIILGVRRILEIIVEKQPKAIVVLHPIFPRQRDFSEKCVFRRRNELVNKEIMKFADGRRIFWCDFNDQFLTREGELSPELFGDQLHPNWLGYEIWHSAVQPYIDFALSDGRLPRPLNRYASFVRSGVYQTRRGSSEVPLSRIGQGLDDPWLNRVLAHRREITASGGAFDVVLFGEDNVAGWETDGKDALAELKKTYSVLNLGCAGDRLVNDWWRASNGELDGFKAQCILMTVGFNDVNAAEADFVDAAHKLILKVINRQLGAKIVLTPLFPSGPNADDAVRKKAHANSIAFRNQVVDGTRVRWLDFNDRFLDEKGDVVRYMTDRRHLNAAGYKDVWLPAVLPHLKEICEK